jgi:ABC-type Fe3+/spermidine/putrescine transport system ATPase subunit/nucleotide-binding universal stress UspA family protein
MSIVLDRLSKVYAGRRVVDDVSLEVGDGELFVLLGSSGSGKSTVLRLISGLAPADSGTILLFGKDVTVLPPQQRGVGFVFQNYSIFRHMTVSRNIEFGLKLRRVPRPERRKKSAELLELIGLGGLGGRYAHELSGGQQQRVALARALAYEPRVLLLDEPFGALDAKIRVQLRRTLREIQRALKVTAVLVTHDQEEAFELGDRIGIVEHGRLLEVGSAEELYARPRSFFVATFLGSGTVLVGRCEDGKARFGPVSLPIPKDQPHEEGDPVRILIRPEQVALGGTDRDAPSLGPAEIVDQTFAGAARRLRLRVPEIAGVRQIFPPTPYGEEGLLVDALVPSERPVPAEPQALLMGWRVLAQPQRRVLVMDGGRGGTEALAAAARIARSIGATLRVFGVAKDADAVAALTTALTERAAAAGTPGAEVRVRSGDRDEQISAELAETYYHLFVVAAATRGDRRRGSSADPAVLERARTPVLFARGEVRAIKTILLCTAVGEPGRAAVRYGAWLAARLQARVLLLHVSREEGEAPTWVRAHLERGVRTLHGQGVLADYKIRGAGTPLDGIAAEARESGFDLVLIGRHVPPVGDRQGGDGVTLQVLRAADRSVLVVPENA